MRLVALNVMQGGGPRTRVILRGLAALEPDVAVLSEFRPGRSGDQLLEGLAAIGLNYSATTDSHAYRADGVAIAARTPMANVDEPLGDSLNRHRVLAVETQGIGIVGVYFPLGKPKVTFWREEFLPLARTWLDRPMVVAGDWNSGSHLLDEAGATLDGAPEFEALSAMGWTDAWRHQFPDGREFTWFSPQPNNNGFRLDHAFLSPALVPRLGSVWFDHGIRESRTSDHSALVVDLHS